MRARCAILWLAACGAALAGARSPDLRHPARREAPVRAAAKAGSERLLVILVEFAGSDTFDFVPAGANKSTWDPIGKIDSGEWTGTGGDCSAIVARNGITAPRKFTYTGPLHNQIERPRSASDTVANRVWAEDFSLSYYRALLFGDGVRLTYKRLDGSAVDLDLTGLSLGNYYRDMSGGAFDVGGDVVGWVRLPHSVWWYGADTCPGARSAPVSVADNGAIPGAGNMNTLATDALAEVKRSYPALDWSQYDRDGDGVMDHLIIVHAGVAEESDAVLLGRTDYGEGSIWSKAARLSPPYPVSPGVAAGPFTLLAEDSALGTFVHEFGHDIGAMDLYDTTDESGQGWASPGFWSPMSDSYVGAVPNTQPPAMDPLHLDWWGWLNPAVISDPSLEYRVTVGQASAFPGGDNVYRGARIDLPDGHVDWPARPQGKWYWRSGQENLTNSFLTLAAPVTLPAGAPASLSFSAAYQIETGYDFLFVQASVDGGKSWKTLTNSHTTCQHASDWQSPGEGLPLDLCAAKAGGFTGSNSGYPNYSNETFDLAEFAGKAVLVRFWYATDTATLGDGAFIDNVRLSSGFQVVFGDDGESGPGNWRATGTWELSDGGKAYPQAYYLQWRNTGDGGGADRGLGDARYRYGPAAGGLLVWYHNERYTDNHLSEHMLDPPSFGPKGRMLLVDAHPEPYRGASLVAAGFANEGANVIPRMQMRDAPLSLVPAAPFSFQGSSYAGRPPVSKFSDALGAYPGLELVGAGPNDAAKRWITRAWSASVVLPARVPYAVSAAGYKAVQPVSWGCTPNLAAGKLDCLGQAPGLSSDGGAGNPADAGGHYGWNVEIVDQSAQRATVRIWNERGAAVRTLAGTVAAAAAPGEVVSLTGFNLAPRTESAVPGGRWPRTLGGATVTVNGVAAPLGLASPQQIQVQIPYGTAPGMAAIVINPDSRASVSAAVAVGAAAPVLLVAGDRAIASNAGGTRNDADHPAPAASTLTLSFTGQGAVDPPVDDGAPPADDAAPAPVQAVTVTVGGQPAAVVVDARLAPGLVGVTAITITVPDLDPGEYPVVVTVGGVSSNAGLVTVGGA